MKETTPKKILILAYDFPPYVSVGGLRPYAWYENFNEFGYFPIVITRQWSNQYGNQLDYIASGDSNNTLVESSEKGIILRTPYNPNLSNRLLIKYGTSRFRLIRKLITAYFEMMQFLFIVGPKSGLYLGAKKYLENNTVDAIIATGDPFILFFYAKKLSRKYKVPWIADYRDPWVQDKANKKFFFRLFIEKRLESKIVKTAIGITTVSNMFLKLIQSNISADIDNRIIINGFNDENVDSKTKSETADRLILAYAGSLYPWHPIESSLKVINKLIICGVNIEFRIFGCNRLGCIEGILKKNLPLKNKTKIYPKLSNKKLMTELAKSHVLLLFNDYSISGTKIYDYLAAKRNIIFCYENDTDAKSLKRSQFHLPKLPGQSEELQIEILKQTNGGVIVKDKNHLADILKNFWLELQESGEILCNSHNVEQYSRKNSVKELAYFINKLI